MELLEMPLWGLVEEAKLWGLVPFGGWLWGEVLEAVRYPRAPGLTLSWVSAANNSLEHCVSPDPGGH